MWAGSMNGFPAAAWIITVAAIYIGKGQSWGEICHLNLIFYSSGGRSVLHHVGIFLVSCYSSVVT